MSQITDRVRVLVENASYRYADMCESAYVEEMLACLLGELGSAADAYEFTIYSNPDFQDKPPPWPPTDRRRVIFFLSDERCGVPYHLSEGAFAVFKQYLPAKHTHPRLFDFPLGVNKSSAALPIVPVSARTHNVFFSGVLNRSRLPLYKEIAGIRPAPDNALLAFKRWLPRTFHRRYPDSFIEFNRSFGGGGGISSAQYAHLLHHSRIALCPPGAQYPSTYRHYEALRAGCAVLTLPMPATPFYGEAPFVRLKSWRELDRTVQQLLSSAERLESLHWASVDWWTHRLSPRAVAGYVLEKLEETARLRSLI